MSCFQVPSAPTNLSVAVYPGDSTKLIATYSDPVSNGGTNTTKYKIEWSTSPDFTSFGAIEYRCPNNPLYEIVTVTTTSTGTITGGNFTLTVINNGVNATTLPIAFNAVSNAADEVQGNIASDDPLTGGSLQSRLQNIGALNRVLISRQSYGSGQYVWTITFLDQGPIGPVSVNTIALQSSTGVANVVLTNPVKGVAYTSCTGAQVIPTLTQGVPYYVRVFAYNKIGYGPPVVSTRSYRPMVAPGLPRSVSLLSYNGTALQVVFSAPDDNGGDSAITYLYVLCLRGG